MRDSNVPVLDKVKSFNLRRKSYHFGQFESAVEGFYNVEFQHRSNTGIIKEKSVLFQAIALFSLHYGNTCWVEKRVKLAKIGDYRIGF